MNVTASASAKTILFGEHAVVYGEPAIAIPLSYTRTFVSLTPNGKEFRVISDRIGLNASYAELDPDSGLSCLLRLLMSEFCPDGLPDDTMEIRSDIPIASGLGSGAALSIAVIRAFAKRFGSDPDTEDINRLAFEIEKVYHGTPSGIDNTVIAYEQPVFFTKSAGFSPFQADLSGLPLLVVDSGIRSRTVDVVSDVRAHLDRNEGPIREIGKLVREACEALKSGSLETIGGLMNENQRLLKAIDVSSSELDELIETALKHGAIGAKLTGAGRGGNIIVLARDRDHAEQLRSLYEERGLHVIC